MGLRTRGSPVEPDRIGQAQRARSVGPFEGRVQAAAHAQKVATWRNCCRTTGGRPAASPKTPLPPPPRRPPPARRDRRGKDGVCGTLTLQAVHCIALIHRVEREAHALPAEVRLSMQQVRSKPLWEELHLWLRLKRFRSREQRDCARHRLQPESLGPAHSASARLQDAGEQQPHRAADAAVGDRLNAW